MRDRKMGKLYVIGVGPGDPSYLTLRGERLLKECKVVGGWGSVLDRFSPYLESKELVRLSYGDEDEKIQRLVNACKFTNGVFLNHGDPSVSDYQLMAKLRAASQAAGVEMELVPGVSSVNASLALLGVDLASLVFLTMHVRAEREELLRQLDVMWNCGRSLLIIPPPDPDGIIQVAERLQKLGYTDDVWIGERITFQDQRLVKTTVKAVLEDRPRFGDLTIMFVPRGSK
jgi:cobalt-precorrin-7 (C5)-methyltransferase